MYKKEKFSIIPAIAISILLLLGLFGWPYGYYTFLRIATTGAAIYYAYIFYKNCGVRYFWFWGLVGLAILFNPIIPVYLGDKFLWGVIDVLSAIFFLGIGFKFRKK